MKKRILALICALTIALGNISAFAEYTDMPEGENETRIADILTKIGIMKGYEDGSFKPSQPITRAEFSTLLYNAIGFFHTSAGGGSEETNNDGFDWRRFFLGSDSDDLKLIYPTTADENGESGEDAVSNGPWNDVAKDYWAYSYLLSMKEQGIISGYGDNTFKPENTVTYNEAIKIILTICGYKQYAETYGGYPEGYKKLAADNKLYNGVTASGDMPMSRMDAATLIYNSFKIKLAPDRFQNGESDKNFLNDIVGVYTVEGTVLSTDVTSIYGDEPSMEMAAKIGDTEFSFGDDMTSIRDYIGRDVRVFLKKSDDDYSLITFEETNRDDVTVIDNSLLKDYDNNTFSYYVDEDSNKEKKVRIRNGSVLIYNGKYLEGYSSETFKSLGNGTITVVKKAKLDFDIVLVESFETGYVESVNAKKKQLTDTLATGNAIINLDRTDDQDKVMYSLFGSDKKPITFDELGQGAVNYYSNGNYLKLYYSTNSMKGKITKIYERDGKNYVKIGETEYTVAGSYYRYAGTSIKKDVDVNAVLDAFGEVAWISDDGLPLEGYVYFIKRTHDESEDSLVLTYYDIDVNKVVTKNTESTIRVVNQKGESEKVSADGLYEFLDGYDGVLKIVLSQDDLVKKIEYPRDKNSTDAKALKLVLESNNQSASENYMGKLGYNHLIRSFAGKVYMNASTKLINVPEDKSEYAYYSSAAFTSLAGGNYLFKLYSFDADSPYAKLAVITKSSNDNYYDTLHRAVPTYLVLNRMNAINEDDEVGVKLTLYSGTTVELFAAADEDGVSAFDNAMNAFNESVGMEVSEGDFVQVAVDNVDGKVISARVVFDADGINPAWCGAKPGENVTKCPENHEHITNILGTIPGSTGFRTANGNKTNPMGYSGSGISPYSKTPGESNNHRMYMYGFVYSTKEGLMEITSENVAERFSGKPDTTNYSYCYYDPSVTKYYIIHKTKDGYTIEKGTPNDIRTYKQAGSKCTRAFFDLSGGSLKGIYILNDDE